MNAIAMNAVAENTAEGAVEDAVASRVAELAACVDMDLTSESLSAGDLAFLGARAVALGCRAVRVSPERVGLMGAAIAADGTMVRVSCGIDGAPSEPNGAALWTSRLTSGRQLDELDIHVSPMMLGEGSEGGLARLLRRLAAVCHAHACFANLVVPADALTVREARAVVRTAVACGMERVVVDAEGARGAARLLELVAAMVDEARAHVAVGVMGGVTTRAELERLVDLGVDSVAIDARVAEAVISGVTVAGTETAAASGASLASDDVAGPATSPAADVPFAA